MKNKDGLALYLSVWPAGPRLVVSPLFVVLYDVQIVKPLEEIL